MNYALDKYLLFTNLTQVHLDAFPGCNCLSVTRDKVVLPNAPPNPKPPSLLNHRLYFMQICKINYPSKDIRYRPPPMNKELRA